jgi:hypothetical protein
LPQQLKLDIGFDAGAFDLHGPIAGF